VLAFVDGRATTTDLRGRHCGPRIHCLRRRRASDRFQRGAVYLEQLTLWRPRDCRRRAKRPRLQSGTCAACGIVADPTTANLGSAIPSPSHRPADHESFPPRRTCWSSAAACSHAPYRARAWHQRRWSRRGSVPGVKDDDRVEMDGSTGIVRPPAVVAAGA
jgi:hypothetical protein